MAGYDLIRRIDQRTQDLDKALNESVTHGLARAKAQREYRIALAEKILEERDKGTPATICSDVCRGDRRIADLCFARDTEDVLYQASLDAINIIKLNIKTLDAQIEREWGRAARN